MYIGTAYVRVPWRKKTERTPVAAIRTHGILYKNYYQKTILILNKIAKNKEADMVDEPGEKNEAK